MKFTVEQDEEDVATTSWYGEAQEPSSAVFD
jgi:hypothetical protein